MSETPDTEPMTTEEMIDKLNEAVDDANEAYDDGDYETARMKLAEVNNNIGNILTMVNIEENREEAEA